jgi:hypothetical protein
MVEAPVISFASSGLLQVQVKMMFEKLRATAVTKVVRYFQFTVRILFTTHGRISRADDCLRAGSAS